MKKPFMIIAFVAIGMFSYGQSGNNHRRILDQDSKSSLELAKSSSITYIDISIQQPGVEECLLTSIAQRTMEPDWLNIYPNPNPGQFTLELQFLHVCTSLLIQMFDLTGKLVFESTEVADGNRFIKDMNVSHLQKGVYFIHVTSKDKVGVKQIIVN